MAIDEGWTSFDYHNINNVRTIFDFLVEKFDFVLSISHLSQIKEHCSNQIHLKKLNTIITYVLDFKRLLLINIITGH